MLAVKDKKGVGCYGNQPFASSSLGALLEAKAALNHTGWLPIRPHVLPWSSLNFTVLADGFGPAFLRRLLAGSAAHCRPLRVLAGNRCETKVGSRQAIVRDCILDHGGDLCCKFATALHADFGLASILRRRGSIQWPPAPQAACRRRPTPTCRPQSRFGPERRGQDLGLLACPLSPTVVFGRGIRRANRTNDSLRRRYRTPSRRTLEGTLPSGGPR